MDKEKQNKVLNLKNDSIWGFGNQLFILSNENSDVNGDKAGKFSSKLHEVKWDTELYRPIFRKLISQSKAIFLNVQFFAGENGASTKEIKNQLSKHSREYRSVLKECAYEIQTQLTTNCDLDDCNLLNHERELLEMFELLWSLFELLFIDCKSNSYIMKSLMEWFALRFYNYDDVVQKVIQSQQRERHPCYWMIVNILIYYGRVEDACKMLSLHTNFNSELYQRISLLLESMPIYIPGKLSYSEYCIKWYQWHDLTVSHHTDGMFSVDQNLQMICSIISGEVEAFVECKDYLQTWYCMFVSHLFYQQPMATASELQPHAKYCFDQFTNVSPFDNIILAIFSLDAQKAIHLSSTLFNNWWLVSHVTDLLTHLDVCEKKNLNFGSNLREFLLLEYATSLLSHNSLWQHGIDYLDHCPVYGRSYISEYLLKINCDCEFKMKKLLRICDLRELTHHAQIIQKEMAVMMLKNNSLGNALIWSCRAKDIQLSNQIIKKIFEDYIKSEKLVDFDIISNLGSAMQLSNHLAFLGKFCEFKQLIGENKLKDALNLLLVLLTEGNAPKMYWMLLFLNLLAILDKNSMTLDRPLVCGLMDRLNQFDISNSFEKVQILEDKEKLKTIRISLAQHLQRLIIDI